MHSMVQLDDTVQPIVTETISMDEGLEEEEEEKEFMNANPNMIPLYLVDLQSIVEKYLLVMDANSMGF